MKKGRKRVDPNTENSWELGGESLLLADVRPNVPTAGQPLLVRLTHDNVYGPCDDVSFCVRIGDPKTPTAFGDQDSVDDWQQLALVEELVFVDDVEMDRADASEPFGREEVPWSGTFETTLSTPEGRFSIEIKVLAKSIIPSGVISDWVLKAVQ